uniref:Uncharacterized protein n=1 Tax=Rhizophora mucronata TaxID=61149 RepID=A0A2P2M3C0_RHIMU
MMKSCAFSEEERQVTEPRNTLTSLKP